MLKTETLEPRVSLKVGGGGKLTILLEIPTLFQRQRNYVSLCRLLTLVVAMKYQSSVSTLRRA